MTRRRVRCNERFPPRSGRSRSCQRLPKAASLQTPNSGHCARRSGEYVKRGSREFRMHPALLIVIFGSVCAAVAAAISTAICKMYRSASANTVVLASSAPMPMLLLGLTVFQALRLGAFPDHAYALELDALFIKHRIYEVVIAAAFALIVGVTASAFLTRRLRRSVR